MIGLGDSLRDWKRTSVDHLGEEIDTVAHPFGIRGRRIHLPRAKMQEAATSSDDGRITEPRCAPVEDGGYGAQVRIGRVSSWAASSVRLDACRRVRDCRR